MERTFTVIEIQTVLENVRRDSFWGDLTFRCRNGEIVLVERRQTIRPETLRQISNAEGGRHGNNR